jgi:tetratricopeptide (TPR) repeat protein
MRSLPFLLFFLMSFQVLAYDNCDRLRQNEAAFNACMNQWHGRDTIDSSASDALSAMHQREYDARIRDEEARNAEIDRRLKESAAAAAAQRSQQETEEQERRRFLGGREASALASRLLIEQRLQALAAKVNAKPRLSPDDYRELIFTAYPEADLMLPWASRAAQEYGGRFKLLEGLSLSMNCPGKRNVDIAGNDSWGRWMGRNQCDTAMQERGVAMMHAYMNEAAPVDRLLICAQSDWRRRQFIIDAFTNSIDNSHTRRHAAQLEDCYARLGDIPREVAEKFNAILAAPPHTGLGEPSFAFFNPQWQTLKDLRDTATIQRLILASLLGGNYRRDANPYEPDDRFDPVATARQYGLDLAWVTTKPAQPFQPGPISLRQLGRTTEAGSLPMPTWSDPTAALVALNKVAGDHLNANRHGEAMALYEAALAVGQQTRGKVDLAQVGLTLHQMAGLFEAHQDAEAAETLYRQAIAIFDERIAQSWSIREPKELLRTSLLKLANLYASQKRYAEQEPLERRRVDIVKYLYGDKHYSISMAYYRLGEALEGLNHLNEAVGSYRDAYLKNPESDDMDRRLAGWTYWRIGVATRNMGHHAQAEEAFDRAQGFYAQITPLPAADIADLYESRVKLYQLTGRQADAAKAQALSDDFRAGKIQQLQPQFRPQAASSVQQNKNAEEYYLINGMNEALTTGRFEDTLRAAEAAIAFVDEAGAHSLEAMALNKMGVALAGLKRFDEAEARFNQALTKAPSEEQAAFAREQLAALAKLRKPADWRDEWRKLYDTALRMNEDDDADQAVAIAKAREALALAEQKGGAQHRLVAESRNTLAVCLRTDQQYPEAEQQYLQALREAEAADGKDSDLVAIIATELATLYDYRTRHAEALPLHRRALAIREKGNNLLALEKSLDLLVDHYRSQRQFVEAEPYSRRLVELAERLNGPDHPIVAVAHTDLGFILFMLKRYNEAEPLYLRALAIAEKNAAKQPRLLQGTLDSLANLYLWMKKPEEAARYKQRRDTLAKR